MSKKIDDQRHASKEALHKMRDESRADDDSLNRWSQFVKGELLGEPPK